MSRDDVTVTPEEMAQAIENAQTAVFRDPPWSPNARAFLALLADRDALRAKLERTKEELAQARRSSLRRMSGRAFEDALFIQQDASSEFYLNATRHADRLMRFFNACRFELGE